MAKSILEQNAEHDMAVESIGNVVIREFISISKIKPSKRRKYQKTYLRILRIILRHSKVIKIGDFNVN